MNSGRCILYDRLISNWPWNLLYKSWFQRISSPSWRTIGLGIVQRVVNAEMGETREQQGERKSVLPSAIDCIKYHFLRSPLSPHFCGYCLYYGVWLQSAIDRVRLLKSECRSPAGKSHAKRRTIHSWKTRNENLKFCYIIECLLQLTYLESVEEIIA